MISGNPEGADPPAGSIFELPLFWPHISPNFLPPSLEPIDENELAEIVTTLVHSARRYSDSPAPIARSRPPDAPTRTRPPATAGDDFA